MTDLRQRIEPIRSAKYLAGSKGQTCKLRFVGICNNDPATVVPCHIHNASFGMGRKADDFAVIDGCTNCHRFLDQGKAWKMDRALLLEYLLRGVFETIRGRIDSGVLPFPVDMPKPFASRPVVARKPKAERRAVPAGRPIQSRNDLRRKPIPENAP